MKKTLFILFFLGGFILASHWDSGREFVLDYSPFVQDKLNAVGKIIKKTPEMTENMINKIKTTIK